MRFYRRWRLTALDGTTFDVPDTRANVTAFGRPRSGRGELAVGYPQIQCCSASPPELTDTRVCFTGSSAPVA